MVDDVLHLCITEIQLQSLKAHQKILKYCFCAAQKSYNRFAMTWKYLKLVFMVSVSGGKVAELLRQSKTVLHMLGRNKVLRDLDTAVQVVHLGNQGEQMSIYVSTDD